MAGRRTLIEGLKKPPKAKPQKEEAFVFGKEDEPQATGTASESRANQNSEEGAAKPPPLPAASKLQAP